MYSKGYIIHMLLLSATCKSDLNKKWVLYEDAKVLAVLTI